MVATTSITIVNHQKFQNTLFLSNFCGVLFNSFKILILMYITLTLVKDNII